MSFTQTVIGGGFVLGLATLAIQSFEPRKQERHLDLGALEYVEINGIGYVRQQVVSTDDTIIPARWQAAIERQENGTTRLLCTGSGFGNYNGEISTWSLDDWTGDDCPEAKAEVGDIFEVSWTYENTYGYSVTIGGRFVLQPDGTLKTETAP